MLHLIMENPLRFILALVIGIATAWWIWGRLSGVAADDEVDETPEPAPAPPAPEPAPAPEPTPEPVVAAAPVTAAAAPSGAGPRIAAAVGAPDDLKRIKGIGPKLEKLCNSLGVTRFDQIAAWTQADIDEVDPYLESFRGRISRDDWVGQAKILASGGTTEFSGRYDNPD